MKALIVNADDFGSSSGINLGVVEAHRNGILTSASMMVDAPASAAAGLLASQHPDLSVGLHVVISSRVGAPADEVERQLERFVELTGKPPSHIDAHHNVHRDERLLPAFLAAAERHGLRLRDHCDVRHIAKFYGQRGGETHLESVSSHAFACIVATEARDGFNELCCHPGYVDEELVSSYTHERRAELKTLCDPDLAALLSAHGIDLVSFHDLPKQ